VITASEVKLLVQLEMDIALIFQNQNIVTFLGATIKGDPVILMKLMTINYRKAYEQERVLVHQ